MSETPTSLGHRPTRRWEETLSTITDVHPSPVSVRGSSIIQSSALRRRAKLTEEKIGQSLSTLDKVVDRGLATPSFIGSPRQSVNSSMYDATHLREGEESRMFSLMDESDTVRDVHLYPSTTQDTTMMTFSSKFQTDSPSLTYHHDTSMSVVIGETTLSNDPILQAGEDLMQAFHSCLCDHPSSGQVLDLLMELSEACSVQINQLKAVSKSNRLSDTISELSLERDTWLLTEVLYNDRLGRTQDGEEMDDMEVMQSRTDKMIVQDYFDSDEEIRQAQLVVDWLEKISANSLDEFPSKVKYFADSVSWENTVHDIQQGLNKGHIVTEVDPDAPARQNRKLSELDESDEQSLCKHVFKCIRAGQLEKAQELCVQCGQSWRAATLDGWKLYHDPNLDKGSGDEIEPVEGNCGRDLWKNSCWEMANCPIFTPHEKAIYASLSGNITQLLPTCQSWYDCTWAYFRVMVDVLVEQKIRSSNRFPPESVAEELPNEYWNAILLPDLIFQEIEASSLSAVRKQATDMYHLTQKFLILGDLESLVNSLHCWLEKYSTSLHHLRYMAHMVLFVKTVGVNYDESKCNDILTRFTEVLIAQRYDGLVALYSSYLPSDSQVLCYSVLLNEVSGVKNQKECLKLAQECGLDVALITKTVVEKMRTRGVEEIPSTLAGVELGQEIEVSKADLQKINVLDWLFYDDSQRGEAVHQSNAMIRVFLAVRKHAAACAVFNKVPPDSPAVIERQWKVKTGDVPLPPNTENDIMEYCSIKAYLEAIESFNCWFQSFHNKQLAPPPSQPLSGDFTEKVAYERKLERYQDEKERWEIQLKQTAQAAEMKIYNVLLFVKGGWMVDVLEGDEDESRQKQLSLLRQLCLPHLCTLLHTIFHSSGNYKKSLQLADAVASERHKLYSVFRPDELRHFLNLLRSSSLELLNLQDVDSFGYQLT